jgi:hypothetical protein
LPISSGLKLCFLAKSGVFKKGAGPNGFHRPEAAESGEVFTRLKAADHSRTKKNRKVTRFPRSTGQRSYSKGCLPGPWGNFSVSRRIATTESVIFKAKVRIFAINPPIVEGTVRIFAIYPPIVEAQVRIFTIEPPIVESKVHIFTIEPAVVEAQVHIFTIGPAVVEVKVRIFAINPAIVAAKVGISAPARSVCPENSNSQALTTKKEHVVREQCSGRRVFPP